MLGGGGCGGGLGGGGGVGGCVLCGQWTFETDLPGRCKDATHTHTHTVQPVEVRVVGLLVKGLNHHNPA